MANEFTRKESVTDYQNYAGRAGSQIDYSAEAAKIATGVNLIASEREGKKAKIQGETDNVVAQLEKADSYQNQTLGQTVLLAASALKDNVLMQSQLMKKGKIKPAEYMAFLQTAKDDITNWGIAAKDWDKSYTEADARQKQGPNGKKIASATETYIKENILAFQNLNNKVPWVSGNGNVYLVDMIEDSQGNKVMPDWDTQKEKFQNMGSMNNRLNYKDDGAKYDVGSLVKSHTSRIGSFITSRITGYTVETGGNVITTEEGARQMEDALSGKKGQADFDELIVDITSSVVNDNTSVANILEQHIGLDYIIAETEQQFVNEGGTDLSKWLKIDLSTVPPSYPDISDEQKNAAKGLVEREILTQMGQTKKHTKGLSGQQPNAGNVAGKKTANLIGGYASQLADVLTTDTANADAILRGLITDVNDNKKADAPDIIDFNLGADEITFYREGADPISIPRRKTTGEIDDLNTSGNEAYNDVDLLNEITALYTSLTGQKANRTEIQQGLDDVGYDLSGKKKRADALTGGNKRSALPTMSNTQKFGVSKESILDKTEAEFGKSGTTGGVFDWLGTDKGSRNSIVKIINESMSGSLKRNLSKNFKGQEAKVQLFSDADANTFMAEFMKSEKLKKSVDKNYEILDITNRAAGEEVVVISIAGVKTPIMLDQFLTSEEVSTQVTKAINSATDAVNLQREGTDNRRGSKKRNSVNFYQAKYPPTKEEKATPAGLLKYKLRVLKAFKDQK